MKRAMKFIVERGEYSTREILLLLLIRSLVLSILVNLIDLMIILDD